MDVTFPEMGDSVAEGTVLEWQMAVGDAVAVDDALVEISTDKVDAEVPSPVAGTIAEILVEPDSTVAVGAVLCRIDAGAGAPHGAVQPAAELERSAAAGAPPPGRQRRRERHAGRRADGRRARHRHRLGARAAARAGA